MRIRPHHASEFATQTHFGLRRLPRELQGILEGIDISCPESEPLEECFENTTAFEWLTKSAHRYGFTLSYPRNNRHGIAYETWHGMYRS